MHAYMHVNKGHGRSYVLDWAHWQLGYQHTTSTEPRSNDGLKCFWEQKLLTRNQPTNNNYYYNSNNNNNNYNESIGGCRSCQQGGWPPVLCWLDTWFWPFSNPKSLEECWVSWRGLQSHFLGYFISFMCVAAFNVRMYLHLPIYDWIIFWGLTVTWRKGSDVKWSEFRVCCFHLGLAWPGIHGYLTLRHSYWPCPFNRRSLRVI